MPFWYGHVKSEHNKHLHPEKESEMKHQARASLLSAVAFAAFTHSAMAQTGTTLEDEIIITATKKAGGTDLQSAPLAVTAFGEAQLETLHVRDLESLSYSIPNVSLDDIGTWRGVANFSIRGLGINSSIPSIDPTVGVFVDGVYMGITSGMVLDIFDLQSIEVLRGPQGILFGRNVTGGAVLINTKKPTDEFQASFKAAAESGFRGTRGNYYLMGSVSGPLVKDKLKAKLSAYYNKDDGYFKNYEGGPNFGQPDQFSAFGKAKTFMVRPSLVFTPNANLEFTLRYEHGTSEGDGPAAQKHEGGAGPIPAGAIGFDRHSLDFSINETGLYDHRWDQFSIETNWDVALGNGTITNIFGFRNFDNRTRADIDASPAELFSSDTRTTQEQWSNELRYAGRFADRLDVTTGLYYFTQDVGYQESRNIFDGFLTFFGGGKQRQSTIGAFAQADYALNPSLNLILGGRYTHERKRVNVATVTLNTSPCNVIVGTCPFDFNDKNSWSNFSPKVGLTWVPDDDLNVYGTWTRGFRSGGYNLRNTSAFIAPGPFDEEKVNAFELGVKARPNDLLRINSALFLNDISNMQREINLSDPRAGVVQIIRNTANAQIWGFESEAQFYISDRLTLLGSIGHTNGRYDQVLFDLNGDFVVDAADKALQIPRLAPWTYSLGFIFSQAWNGVGTWTLQSSLSHRDRAFYTDNNLGTLNGADMLDINLSLHTENQITLSLYGKNLLNEVTHGGDTQLPNVLGGGTFAPLNKGRVIGLELKVDFN